MELFGFHIQHISKFIRAARRLSGLPCLGSGHIKGNRLAVRGGNDRSFLVGPVHHNAVCPERIQGLGMRMSVRVIRAAANHGIERVDRFQEVL